MHCLKKLDINVSRETIEKLEIYKNLLLKWQKAINLISPTTIEDMDERHFLDSAQLIKLIPNHDIILADMGAGAGFPALVLAILGIKEVHLIESDVRKATFLKNVSRETGLSNVTVHDKRIEDVIIPSVDVITARALATLAELLAMSERLATENHPFECLFLKGEKTDEELAKARKKWDFDVEITQSLTDKTGKLLKISNLVRKTN